MPPSKRLRIHEPGDASFLDLPDEIISLIVQGLPDQGQQVQIGQCCRRLRQISRDSVVNLTLTPEHCRADKITTITSRFSGLRHLILSDYTDLCDEHVRAIIDRHPRLVELTLRPQTGMGVTDTALQTAAAKCTALKSATFHYCQNVTDAGLQVLASACPQLQIVDVGETRVTEQGILGLSQQCANLRHLDIAGFAGNADAACMALSSNSRNLTYLNIAYSDVTDEGIGWISRGCLQLRTVLTSHTDITDTALQHLSSLEFLEQLNITDIDNLTDTGLGFLAGCSQLRLLFINSTSKFSTHGWKELVKGCRALQSLVIIRTMEEDEDFGSKSEVTDPGVGDEEVELIARGCRDLRTLDLFHMDITDRALAALATCCPRLHRADFSECGPFTQHGLFVLVRQCHELRSLSIPTPLDLTQEGREALEKLNPDLELELLTPK